MGCTFRSVHFPVKSPVYTPHNQEQFRVTSYVLWVKANDDGFQMSEVALK